MRKWIWMAILLTVVSRGAIFLYYKPWSPSYDIKMAGEDPYLYHRLAIDLLRTGDYGGNPEYDASYHSATVRPPGYPLFVSMIYALFGPYPWVVILVQIFLAVLSVLLVMAVSQKYFGQTAAIVAGSLFALHPVATFTTITLYTETFFMFLVCLMLYVMSVAHQQTFAHRKVPLALAWFAIGCLAGISVVVRVSMLYLAPLIILIWGGFYTLQPFRMRSIFTVMALIGFLLPLVPWALYNKNHYGTYRLSASGEYNLLILTVGQAFAQGGLEDYQKTKQRFVSVALDRMRQAGLDPQRLPMHRALFYREVAFEIVRDNPGLVFKGFLKGIVKFWILPSRASGESFIEGTKGFTRILFTGIFIYAIVIQLVLMLGSIWGVVCLWKQREWRWLIIFLTVSLYFTLTAGAAGSSRFFLQVLPFLLPVSAYGLVQFVGQIRKPSKLLSEV